jgi:transcriptional regulator GlxA family with amidase domain
VSATHDLSGLRDASIILAPGRITPAAPIDPRICAALHDAAARGVPVVGLCGGAFTLAQVGLLAGRRATTHWLLADELRHRYPEVRVEQEDLYVGDGGIWTSAGTASAIDLCLHLVRLAHGAGVAATIARRMVTSPHRPGNQRPYIETPLPAARDLRDPLAEAIDWARQNLGRRLTVRELAERAHMSERTFARKFTKATGATPQRWLLHQRLLYAQQLLESTQLPVQAIAERAGFGAGYLLRRHFGAYFATTPSAYRKAFRGGSG